MIVFLQPLKTRSLGAAQIVCQKFCSQNANKKSLFLELLDCHFGQLGNLQAEHFNSSSNVGTDGRVLAINELLATEAGLQNRDQVGFWYNISRRSFKVIRFLDTALDFGLTLLFNIDAAEVILNCFVFNFKVLVQLDLSVPVSRRVEIRPLTSNDWEIFVIFFFVKVQHLVCYCTITVGFVTAIITVLCQQLLSC